MIIGSGQAGYSVAREFRRIDGETPLVIVTADDGVFYSKPRLSNAFAQQQTADSLVSGSAEAMAAKLKARVITASPVKRLDPAEHAVDLGQGSERFQKAVLAWGAEQRRVPVGGEAATHILTVNSRLDYASFRRRLQSGERILIMGAGLIGCEFANDLVQAGYRVTVVDPAAWPLPRLLPQPLGQAFRDALAALGVEWRLGTTATALEHGGGRALHAILSDGDTVHSDVALSAIGLQPVTEPAARAGLSVRRGIVVDRHLRTSAADVYAIGDCAEVEGLVLPFIMPIMHGAKALARSLADQPTPLTYPAMPVVIKTPACPTVVAPPPENHEGTWAIDGDAPHLQARFIDHAGRLTGFALTGEATKLRMELTRMLPPWLA